MLPPLQPQQRPITNLTNLNYVLTRKVPTNELHHFEPGPLELVTGMIRTVTLTKLSSSYSSHKPRTLPVRVSFVLLDPDLWHTTSSSFQFADSLEPLVGPLRVTASEPFTVNVDGAQWRERVVHCRWVLSMDSPGCSLQNPDRRFGVFGAVEALKFGVSGRRRIPGPHRTRTCAPPRIGRLFLFLFLQYDQALTLRRVVGTFDFERHELQNTFTGTLVVCVCVEPMRFSS